VDWNDPERVAVKPEYCQLFVPACDVDQRSLIQRNRDASLTVRLVGTARIDADVHDTQPRGVLL
jgi:hypothetical protein